MSKRSAVAIATLLLALIVSPIAQHGRETPRDSFPLSYYPMFSKDRGETLELIGLEGVNADGQSQYLPIEWIGTGGFHQVRKQINRAAELGDLGRLCRQAAVVVAAHPDPAYQKIDRVRFVRLWFDIGEYFAGNKEPDRRSVLVTMPVERAEDRSTKSARGVDVFAAEEES